MTYSLITLPNLPTFDSIREYLYTHNFRYTNKLPTDPAHITLSQLNLTTEYNVHHLKSLLRKQLQNHSPFSLSQRTLINQEHKWISNPPQRKERYPQGCARIALGFDDPQLKQLSQTIITATSAVDTSYEYAKNIAQAKGEKIEKADDLYNYLANHMNICNYARLDKADEAIQYLKGRFTEKEILIDRIALKEDKQGILWTISL